MAGTQRPPTFDHLRKMRPVERRVTLQPDPEDPGSAVTLVFRSIGRKAWSDLLGKHPATDDQKADMKARFGQILGDEYEDPSYNLETFPVAAVAACCTSPSLSEDEVAELFDVWNLADATACFTAALEANSTSRVVEAGKGSAPTPSTESG